MMTCRCVDQSGCHSQAVTGFLDAALQNVPNAKFLAHLMGFDGPIVVPGHCATIDDEQSRYLSKRRYDVLSQAIRDVSMLIAIAKIAEG